MRPDQLKAATLMLGITQVLKLSIKRHLPSARLIGTLDTKDASTIVIEALENKFEIRVKYLGEDTDKLDKNGETNETETD